jgi:hypothetical protein
VTDENPIPDIGRLIGLSGVNDQVSRVARQMEQRRLATEEAMDAVWAANQAKTEREERSVQLAEQLVRSQRDLAQSQSELLEIQRMQALDSSRDRRIQYAVLTVGVLGIVATTVLSIAIATKTWLWPLVFGVPTFLAVSGLALLIVRGRRSKADS